MVQWSVTDRAEVLRVLQCTACCAALEQVRNLIPSDLRGVQDPTPPKHDKSGKWSERTLVDKELSMREYLREAVELFPRTVTGKGMGPVLKAVVRKVASLREGVIPWRADQERSLKAVAKSWRRRTLSSKSWFQITVRGFVQGLTSLFYTFCARLWSMWIGRSSMGFCLALLRSVMCRQAGGSGRSTNQALSLFRLRKILICSTKRCSGFGAAF